MEQLMDKRYVQKSRIFLLPLIEVKRDEHIRPINTYLSVKGKEPLEYRLILPFNKDTSSEFDYYESNYLLDSKYLDQQSYFETESLQVYYYDLSPLAEDYEKFLYGQYSEISSRSKTLINLYWGTISGKKFEPHPKVDAYLNPNKEIYEQLSFELNVSVPRLMKVKEILNPPDTEKETLSIDTIKYQINDQVESQY